MSPLRSRTGRGAGLRSAPSPPFPMLPVIPNANANYPQWGPAGMKREFFGWKLLCGLLSENATSNLTIHRGILWLFIEDGFIDEDISEKILEGGVEAWAVIVQAMAENEENDFHWSVIDHLYQHGYFEERLGHAIYQS